MKYYYTLILVLVCCCALLAQSKIDHVPQQFLVQLAPNTTIRQAMKTVNQLSGSIEWQAPERISPALDIWKITYRQAAMTEDNILQQLQEKNDLQVVQYNHYIQLRKPSSTTPNDPLFANQWQHINTGAGAGIDLDTDLAWDVTTGGLTALQDTIVVAIIDDGISQAHDDLKENLWYNYAEIPFNGIDDDNNGYVDDYQGWNVNAGSDLVAGGSHGTSVAGIVGAEGDNSIGTAGVNWNVKMMIIKSDFNTTESVVLGSYGYALQQRKIYNQTQGAAGAFVVATNASWGRDNAKPSDSPLWCSFYDTLGRHGILNVGATANNNVDVDIQGDLPTTCPSDYLISVTNIDRLGRKVPGAAYGSTSIDLGAFGDGVYTTASPNTYGGFGGTSSATPHVTATIALMYAAACTNFGHYARIHPDSAALRMKNYILQGVVPAPDLNGITTSGGRLNINNSVQNCLQDCPTDSCFAAYRIGITNRTDTNMVLNWQAANSTAYVEVSWREKNTGLLIGVNKVVAQVGTQVLSNLLPCTEYDVTLESICSAIAGERTTITVKTDGCCEPPSAANVRAVLADSAQLYWQPVLAAQHYWIRYQPQGDTTWDYTTTTDTIVWLTNLMPCTYYQVAVATICQNGDTTVFNTPKTLLTRGCQSCANINYCVSRGDNSTDDFISRFSIDDFEYQSGNNGGYLLFDSIPILLNIGDYHSMSITQGKSYVEHIQIWLDINQDGDFSDVGELLYQNVFNNSDTVKNGSFVVPSNALSGTSRLRVSLRWNRLPPRCGSFTYGEVEDYCVQLVPGTPVRTLEEVANQLHIYPNPFDESVNISYELTKSTTVDLLWYNALGQLVYQKQLGEQAAGKQQIRLRPNLPKGIYWIQLQTPMGYISRKVVQQ